MFKRIYNKLFFIDKTQKKPSPKIPQGILEEHPQPMLEEHR